MTGIRTTRSNPQQTRLSFPERVNAEMKAREEARLARLAAEAPPAKEDKQPEPKEGDGGGQQPVEGSEQPGGEAPEAGRDAGAPEGGGDGQSQPGEGSEGGGQQEVTEEGEVIEEPQRKTQGELNQDPEMMLNPDVVAAMAADPEVSKALRDLALALANYNAKQPGAAQAAAQPAPAAPAPGQTPAPQQ